MEIDVQGRLITTFKSDMPMESGYYRLESEIEYERESVKSIRVFTIKQNAFSYFVHAVTANPIRLIPDNVNDGNLFVINQDFIQE